MCGSKWSLAFFGVWFLLESHTFLLWYSPRKGIKMVFKLDIKKKEYQRIPKKNLISIGWKEKDLETLVSNNIQDFISTEDLMTLFTERPWKEEPDILALDRKGDLYVFELKRWSGESENLLQVFKYGQMYGNKGYEYLETIFRKHIDSKDSLKKYHQDYFGLDQELSEDEFNKYCHFAIVTSGLDLETADAIRFWRSNGIDIRSITYYLFEIDGSYYIEFNAYSPFDFYEDIETSYYVLNTNLSNRPTGKDEMLAAEKASAYWPGHRELIQKIQCGDRVFLYHNGEGIVAYGKADGKLRKAECDGHPDYEYFMKLNDFHILQEPISAARIKEIMKRNIVFRQTMFSISEQDADAIIDNSK